MALLFSITLVSAGFQWNDYTTKWQLCGALAFNNTQCDLWWEGVAEFPEDNPTNHSMNESRINELINKTFAELGYNKTEIDNLINATRNSSNYTGNITGITQGQFDNWTADFSANIDENYLSKRDYDLDSGRNNNSSGSSGWDIDPMWLLAGVAVVIGLFWYAKNKKEEQQRKEASVARPSTEQEKMMRQMLELKKLQNKVEGKLEKEEGVAK